MNDRLGTLTAIRDGTVTARHINAPGSPLVFEPREHHLAATFLRRAGLIETETTTGHNRSRPVTITVTERGKRVLSAGAA